MQIKTNKIKGSLVEIDGVLPWADFEKYEVRAVKKLGENLNFPGFRPGHIPDDMLRKNVSDNTILDEMAQTFLSEGYYKILADNKIDALGHPEVTLTKIARGNPLEFKIKTAVLPEFALPDYKKIAAGVEKSAVMPVTEEEVEKTILEIRKMRVPKVKHEGCEDEKCTHEGELPELNDEFVKSLGQFENVADFLDKLKKNIELEKSLKEKDKLRAKIVEGIVNKTDIEIPDILIDAELDKMLLRLKDDVKIAKSNFEDYLKQIGKTEEVMRKEWRQGATERVKAELIIGKMVKTENIQVDSKEIEREVEQLLQMYKGADPTRSRAYVENVLKNEKLFQLLETQ